jgi:hypothetical protein
MKNIIETIYQDIDRLSKFKVLDRAISYCELKIRTYDKKMARMPIEDNSDSSLYIGYMYLTQLLFNVYFGYFQSRKFMDNNDEKKFNLNST